MRTFGQHMDSVKGAMNVRTAESKIGEIIRATNLSANSIAGLFPINRLADKITVSPGDRLPANMAGISMVLDASDNSQIFRRGEGAAYLDEEMSRYYLDMDISPFSKIDLPFKSTGSIAAGSNILDCPDMVHLITGTYDYEFKCGDTVWMAVLDANGEVKYDAAGKMVIEAIPSSNFNPQLPGVRFYNSEVVENSEAVYYGENEELAYWKHPTLGWIMSDIEKVGDTPNGYFAITDGEGVGVGEWEYLFITFESDYVTDSETVSEDDFNGMVICITNKEYGDFYYKVESVNQNNTFNLNRTHPKLEEDSVVRIYTEESTRIRFVDSSEEDITSGTYDVYYWTYPNPMTESYDIIPFAYPDYLELMTVRRLPDTKDRRPVSKTELDDAKRIARKKEHMYHTPGRPLTQAGVAFGLSAASEDAYGVRGE